jgi:translation elongation factor EF-G
MSEREKIIKFLEIVYINLVNKKLDLFMDMTRNKSEEFRSLFSSLFGSTLGGEEEKIEDQKVDKVRQKFYNFIIKYRDRPVDFFKDEIENYSYNANKMIKKLSKLYDMAKDDENVNESIINWELHQKLMEKKYGKRPIQTKINPLR